MQTNKCGTNRRSFFLFSQKSVSRGFTLHQTKIVTKNYKKKKILWLTPNSCHRTQDSVKYLSIPQHNLISRDKYDAIIALLPHIFHILVQFSVSTHEDRWQKNVHIFHNCQLFTTHCNLGNVSECRKQAQLTNKLLLVIAIAAFKWRWAISDPNIPKESKDTPSE